MCPRRSRTSPDTRLDGLFRLSFHPRGTCALGICIYVRIYVWHMHAACRRPPCVARTFLSVGMYVYVCMRVCYVSLCTHRTTIHRYLARPPSRDASRLHAARACNARVFECTNRERRVILSSFALRLSRVHINTCLPRAFIRTGLLTAPMSRDRDRN